MFLHEVKLQECVTDPSTQLAKVFVRTDGHRATSELNTQNQKNEHSARPERSSRLRNRVRVQRTQQQLCLHKQLAIRFNTKKTSDENTLKHREGKYSRKVELNKTVSQKSVMYSGYIESSVKLKREVSVEKITPDRYTKARF